MNGLPVKANIILLERTDSAMTFNGRIHISSPDRRQIISSRIEHGTIRAFHAVPAVIVPTTILPGAPEYQVMQEVIIVASYPPSGIDWSTWINLMAIFENGGGGWANYYEYYDGSYYTGGSSGGGTSGGGGGSSSNGGSGSGGGTVLYEEPMMVDVENQYGEEAIDVVKFMNCFGLIPDAGATCSIEIYTDLPVNGDASKFFDWTHGTPGHVFIQLRKENGTQAIVQNIGFYPKVGWKLPLTPAAMQGKIVNNEGHEFNASYKVDISPAQLNLAISKIYAQQNMDYDIINNNCTDWALNIFNGCVKPEEQISIPMYDLPGNTSPTGSRTPQGLYQRLEQIKLAAGANAAAITLPLLAWVGNSHGPCN